MEAVVVVVALLGVALAAPVVTEDLVHHVNSVQSLWTASLESPTANLERTELRRLLGTYRTGGPVLPQRTYPAGLAAPDTFDSRTNWPDCSTIKDIRDQSDCGSCWAFGAVEAMSDRECIVNKRNLPLSAEDMNSCSGGGSCDGGYPSSAFSYWHSTGLVSEECRPYSLPSCDHHIPDSKNPCPSNEYPTPDCVKKCLNSSLDWKSDKHKAANVYSVAGEQNIMTEIAKNGPCETAFDVYADFLSYKTGVYHHVSGSFEGGHAVKFVGWGVDNGTKYWLVANSWNTHWGEQGFFRIKKGSNECGIEDTAYCGEPVKI